jgi:hypothetical protein
MKTIQILRDSIVRGTCRSCGREVDWATSPTGERLSFDPPLALVPDLDASAPVAQVDRVRTWRHLESCRGRDGTRKTTR